MKVGKLAELTVEELLREESSLEEQIFRLRFQLGTGNIENPSKIRQTRRVLARVKTLLREKELGIGSGRPRAGRGKGEKATGSDSEAK